MVDGVGDAVFVMLLVCIGVTERVPVVLGVAEWEGVAPSESVADGEAVPVREVVAEIVPVPEGVPLVLLVGEGESGAHGQKRRSKPFVVPQVGCCAAPSLMQ